MNRIFLFMLTLSFTLSSSAVLAQFETEENRLIREEKRKKYREERKEREKKEQKKIDFYEDKEIENRVRSELILSPEFFDAFLTIKVENRVVYLGGRVLSEAERQFALQAVYRVDGVSDVKMNVVVKPLSSEDQEELEGLRSRSSANPVQPLIFKPEKRPTLEAPGPSISEKLAEKMRIDQEQTRKDAQIKKDVSFAIRMAVDLTRVQGVYVSVYHGSVTLSGVVADNLVRQQIARAARGVRGVKSVSNQLQVR